MRSRIYPVLLCSLLAALLLTACGMQPAEAPAEPEMIEAAEVPGEEPAVKTEFTREELLADYDQLWKILEEDYPFLPVLEEHGIDWEQLRADYRERLRTQEPNVASFAALIRQMFGQMENFAHLQFVTTETLAVYASSDPAAYPGTDPWYELTQAPQTQAVYALLAAGDEPAETEYPEVETAYYADCKTACFHFRTLNYFVTERDSTVVADYLATLPEVEHVIIDITGNSGGNSDYVVNNIIAPLGGGEDWTRNVYLRDTPLTEQFFFENESFDVQPVSALTEPVPESVTALGMEYFYVRGGEMPSPEPVSYDRWLLIDSRVYSSSEYLAAYCKATGWATLVGTTTRGDGVACTSPVMAALPNTGLLIRFTCVAGVNMDGTLNAETGTKPDYPCKSGELPLSKCLELIRNG